MHIAVALLRLASVRLFRTSNVPNGCRDTPWESEVIMMYSTYQRKYGSEYQSADRTAFDARQQALREVRQAIAAKRQAEAAVVEALKAYYALKNGSSQK